MKVHIWKFTHLVPTHKYSTSNAKSFSRFLTPLLSSLPHGNNERVQKYTYRSFGDGKLSNNQSHSQCCVHWKRGEMVTISTVITFQILCNHRLSLQWFVYLLWFGFFLYQDELSYIDVVYVCINAFVLKPNRFQ